MSSTPNNQHGSLETAVAGQYDFTISEILSEAWARIYGYKLPYAIITSVYFLIYFVALVSVIAVMGEEDSARAQAVIQLLSFAMMPMSAALTMMGLDMAMGRPIAVKQLFAYYNIQGLAVIGLQIVMMMAIVFGLLLFIIPGIYLSIALMFAVPLMLEKNISIIDAFEASRKAATHHWFKLFGLLFVMGVILFLSMLPLGIGLIWTMPMMMAVIGVLYRRMFGINGQADSVYL